MKGKVVEIQPLDGGKTIVRFRHEPKVRSNEEEQRVLGMQTETIKIFDRFSFKIGNIVEI